MICREQCKGICIVLPSCMTQVSAYSPHACMLRMKLASRFPSYLVFESLGGSGGFPHEVFALSAQSCAALLELDLAAPVSSRHSTLCVGSPIARKRRSRCFQGRLSERSCTNHCPYMPVNRQTSVMLLVLRYCPTY